MPNYVLGQKINFMDISIDKELIFIGGINNRTNHAIITVLQFGRSLEICSELCLKSLNVQKVLSMKLSSINKEIGIVTTNRQILLMGIDYSAKMIDVLKVIDIQMTCLYSNICFFEKCCYIATGNY